jgi:dethiobiotin synthetase
LKGRPLATPGLLVAGTDTGVGKTAVSVALLRLARRRGLRLVPFKPAETGCAGGLPADARRLRAAAGRADLPLSLICPYTFDAPVAPAAAARASELSLPRLTAAAHRAAATGDALLIEGAGGLLSPYGRRLTAADLAADLGVPLLLVARNGLGTINHTVLCLNEIARRGLEIAALILVNTSRHPTPDRADNARLIADATGIAAAGTLPFVSRPNADRLADATAAIDLLPVWRRLSSAAAGARSRRASSGR